MYLILFPMSSLQYKWFFICIIYRAGNQILAYAALNTTISCCLFLFRNFKELVLVHFHSTLIFHYLRKMYLIFVCLSFQMYMFPCLPIIFFYSNIQGSVYGVVVTFPIAQRKGRQILVFATLNINILVFLIVFMVF